MLLACGAIDAITAATGTGPHTSFAEWQMSSQPLWDAVSAIAMSAASESSLQAVSASVQEADAWGQETGGPSVFQQPAYVLHHAFIYLCSRRCTVLAWKKETSWNQVMEGLLYACLGVH